MIMIMIIMIMIIIIIIIINIITSILYIKTLGFFCLFVCLSELIEELGSRRDMKIGM